MTLRSLETLHIADALRRNDGNRKAAAEELGIHPSTLVPKDAGPRISRRRKRTAAAVQSDAHSSSDSWRVESHAVADGYRSETTSIVPPECRYVIRNAVPSTDASQILLDASVKVISHQQFVDIFTRHVLWHRGCTA